MTQLFVGIDLGTSSVRATAIDAHGAVRGTTQRAYRILRPRPGFAEQDPDEWWSATCDALRELLQDIDARTVGGVGVTGQMHGLVALDGAGEPVRPAIIWPDTRSAAEVERLTATVGAARVRRMTGISPAVGLLGPSLAWIRQHEPATYASIARLLLPKDYVRYRLVGDTATEPSDACGTLLYDLDSGRWSGEITRALDIDAALLPAVRASTDVAGTIREPVARETGLAAGAPVVLGGGDQATAAVTLGLDHQGATAVAISTGGTVLQAASTRPDDSAAGLHVLRGVASRLLLMGAILAAGQALDWVARVTLGHPSRHDEVRRLVDEAAGVAPGADGLLFLPYLNGERTPVMDSAASGLFLGLTTFHERGHLVRAVLEGVALALGECVEVVSAAGRRPEQLIGSGGGMRHRVWRQILADVTGLPVVGSRYDEHSAVGAALTAAAAVHARATPRVVPEHPSDKKQVWPRESAAGLYQERAEQMRAAYAASADLMHRLRA
jgi:xylulokinase